MSEAVACPSCQRALPESVVRGPNQAVVRCEGCSTLLLWSHGKVVRSARSNPSTLMGVPVQKPPPPAIPPAKPRAPAKTLMGIATPAQTPPPPAPSEEQLDEKDLVATRPPPLPGKPAD